LAIFFHNIEDLVAILERRKRIIITQSWVEPKTNGNRGFKLQATLSDENSTILGVKFEIGCSSQGFELPSRVVLMAEINGKPRAMARIDINGSRHENTKSICGEWQHKDAGRTHFHDTRLHLGLSIDALFSGDFGDLPVAKPIHDMPEDFSQAMEKCGILLNIENMAEIDEPKWQPRQFLF
jgi:hypothetical protein